MLLIIRGDGWEAGHYLLCVQKITWVKWITNKMIIGIVCYEAVSPYEWMQQGN